MWFALATAFLAAAQAQDSPLVGSAWELLDSVEADALSGIVDTNARVYGVAGFLNRRAFPIMDQVDEEFGLFVGGEVNQVTGVVRLPTLCNATLRDLDSSPACYAVTDMISTTGAVVAGNQYIAVFYSASFNGIYAPDFFISRWIMPIALAPFGYFQLLTAPLQTGPLKVGPGFQDVIGTSRMDYVVGLRGGAAGVHLHAGFLGSDAGSGFYTNVSEKRLRLLASAVMRENFSELPFFLGGLVSSPILEDLADLDGVRPSAFVRKLALKPTSAPEAPDKDRAGDLWSGHLGSTTPIVDIEGAVSVKPLLAHSLTISLHNPGYPDPGEVMEDGGASGMLQGGFVQMPALPWYGVDQALVPFVEGRVNVSNVVEFALGYNSQEVLTNFPFARRSFQVKVDWQLGKDL